MYDIVIVSADEWNGIQRVRHQIANHFSRRHRVLFIENPRLTYASILRDRGRIRNIFNSHRLRQYGNISVYTPPLVLPFWERNHFINRLNNLYLLHVIRPVIQGLGFMNTVMWYFYYNHSFMAGKLGESLAVYTAHDVWEESDWRPRDVTLSMERSLIDSVDLVFFTSYINYLNKKEYNPHSHYISHGSPEPETVKFERPADLPDKGRIIGYWGLVDASSIDISLVRAIANAYPDDAIVLIGLCPNTFEKELSGLLAEKNIHYLGMKDREYMAAYLQHFDIGLIPYPRIPFRLRCSPLKVFDYMSFGLPVVSIDVHELEQLKDLVYISDDRDGFVRQIGAALNEEILLREKRKEYCRNNSWKSRLEAMEQLIEERLQEA